MTDYHLLPDDVHERMCATNDPIPFPCDCRGPRLVAALRAVEALHPALPIRLGFDAGKAMCGTCGTYAPCPTVTAIRDALGQP